MDTAVAERQRVGSTQQKAAIATARSLYAGKLRVEVYAKEIDHSPRWVRGKIAEGMPAVRIGRCDYIDVAEANAWLLAQGRK